MSEPVLDLDAVVVTPMRHRHLDGVLAIEARTYPRPWSSKLFEDELERRGRCYLVARVGSTVVGYAGLLMIADDGHVATVAVDPDHEGRGIATRLVLELVRGALDLGANQLTLEVRASNRRAQDLYRRFGFVPVGARKAYYADNGEDAIVMWAHEVAGDEYADRLAEIERALPSPTVRVSSDGSTPSEPPGHPVQPARPAQPLHPARSTRSTSSHPAARAGSEADGGRMGTP